MIKGNVQIKASARNLNSNLIYGVTSELKEKIVSQQAVKDISVVADLCKMAKINLSTYENLKA